MQASDRKQFYATLGGVCELYGKKASPEFMDIYFEAVRGHELIDICRAFNLHVNDPDQGKFMPMPSDVSRLLGGSKQTRALQAWSRVERAIREVGPYQSVVFDDPIIHAVLEDMGGWIDLCATKNDKDLEFRASEFGKRYQGYALQGGQIEYQRRMIGLTEADCNSRKLPAPKPVLIGSAERAMLVLNGGSDTKRQLTTDLSSIGRLSHGVSND